ncbi:MAG: hypothetical protein ACUVQG_09605 [Thermogutta sp.]
MNFSVRGILSTTERYLAIPTLRALGFIAFLPIVFWGIFLFPIGDDLGCANWPWGAIFRVPVMMWQSWSGCYTAYIIRAMYHPVIKHEMLWLTPMVFLLLHFVGGTVVFLLFKPRSLGTAFTFSVIWILCYFGSMPSPAETTFWATGMVVYEPGNVLALLFTVLAGHPGEEKAKNRMATAAMWVIAPILIGVHFVFSLWTLAVISLRGYENKWRRCDLALLLWCLLFVAVVFVAPGNFQRYSVRMEGSTVTAGYIVTRSLGSFFEFLIRELSLVQNWAWLALGTVVFGLQRIKGHRDLRLPAAVVIRMLVITLPLFGVFVLSSLTREVPPPLRTLNAVHYLLIVGLTAVVIPALVRLRGTEHAIYSTVSDNTVLRGILAVSLCLAILSPNYVRCVRELLTAAPEYQQYWYEVKNRVADAKRQGQRRVEIPANPQKRPVTVFHPSFLGRDPSAWPNKEYAKFLEVAEVVALETE